MREAGGRAAFRRIDVAEEEQVTAMVEHALSDFGRLDLAYNYNNAGIEGPQALLAEQDISAVQHVFDVMIEGVYLCMQAEIPAMMESGGGSIVNAGSMWGPRGLPALVALHDREARGLGHDEGRDPRLR